MPSALANSQQQWVNTSTTTTATGYIWSQWNALSSTNAYVTQTATNTASTVWYEWNSGYSNSALGNQRSHDPQQYPQGQLYQAPLRNEAYEAELQRQLAQSEERNKKLRAELATAAEKRALELLMKNLNKSQREEFLKDKSFTVVNHASMRRYRIRHGYSRNIDELDKDGKRLVTLCAHPSQDLPNLDHMLAQKLMLEHSEDEFLAIANRS